jgi:hypothetical protein
MNKPIAKVIGKNGNIFNILSIASKALNDSLKANEMTDKVLKSKSYDEGLAIISEYVDMQ